ncbi:MAG: hypothetical protein KBC96_06575 [Armatimonadetes bacterium]|nr:hypothetical protein [Armatimonadota bacterium]
MMLTRCLSLCCVLLFWNVPSSTASQWYSGIVHVHTTFSDGSDNIPQRVETARKLGYKFLIVTDHYEQINSLEKPTAKYGGNLANPAAVDITFKDYRRNCDEQTTDGEFVTIPGAEIQAIWKAESDTQDMSHTLALGPLGESGSKDLDKLLSKQGSQREIISCVNGKMRMLPVAAHPTLISEKSFPKVWEWQRCRYDLRSPEAYEGIRGVEFFNSETPEQDRGVLDWYMSLIRDEMKKPQNKRKTILVTAGCDSHGWKDLKDLERWLRVTRVWADELTSEGLLKALGEGRCYASAMGAYLKESSHLPGGTAQNVGIPTFRFTVALPARSDSFLNSIVRNYGVTLKVATELLSEKIGTTDIVMYRDGVEVPESRKSFKGTPTSVSYEWTDKSASLGEHWYVLCVDGLLVTSPIALRVTGRVTDDIAQIIAFLRKHNKPALVGSVVKTMEQEGYHVEHVLYGDHETGATKIMMKGFYDFLIMADIIRNEAVEARLGMIDYRDGFWWSKDNGFSSTCDHEMGSAYYQRLLDKILANFTVTEIGVELQTLDDELMRRMEAELGPADEKSRIWGDGAGHESGPWEAEWGKPTRFQLNPWTDNYRIYAACGDPPPLRLADLLPYETDGFPYSPGFRINPPDAKGVYVISMVAIFNAGVNGPPISEQLRGYYKDIGHFKELANAWIRSKGYDPSKMKIRWDYTKY